MARRKHTRFNRLRGSLSRILNVILFDVHPAIIIAGIMLITLFWASFLPSLKFNYDIESFFSTEDPEVDFYYNHLETFENENDFLLIGIKNSDGIFQQNFLERIDALGHELKQISNIEKVYSPTSLYETIKGPLGGLRIPLVHVDEPDRYSSDKKRIYKSGLYVNSFFSPDSTSVSLMIKKKSGLSMQGDERLLYAVNSRISDFTFDEFHIAGRIHTQHYYMQTMKEQMALFGFLAFVLFISSLFMIFRCIKYVLLSLGAVVLSLIWIFGIIGWLGIPLDLMLTLLPALIFVISTSSSIHLISRFRKEYMVGFPKQFAIRKSIIETGMPNFLNAFTTTIGFVSLVMIPVIPIQRFGLLTGAGILISFFIGLLFVPTALKVMQIEPSRNKMTFHAKRKSRFLIELVTNNPKLIAGAFSLIILLGIYFSFHVKINNHFLDDLSTTSSLKKDLRFFERNFSGIRPFEMNIQAKAYHNILDLEALQEIELVENYLKADNYVGFVFSPLSFIKQMNKAIHGGKQQYYCLPSSQEELDEVLKLADKQGLWNRFLLVMSNDKETGRIAGRTLDEGSLSLKSKNEKLVTFLKNHTQYLQYKITGAAQLMDNANSNIARNLMKGILLAVAISTLIIGLLMRSLKLAAISLIPNLIPLLLVAGCMGVTGIPLKVATSLIFTIVYGIAVDDTIHFLNSYRLNSRLYSETNEAIKQTLSDMWRPMLFTSIVLFSGFMIFILSEFSSISNLGLLIGGSLVIALFTDLLLLPVLLTNLLWKPITIKRSYFFIGRTIRHKNQESPNLQSKIFEDKMT